MHRASVVTYVSITVFQHRGSHAHGQGACGVRGTTPRMYQAITQRAIFRAAEYYRKHVRELDESRPQLRKTLFGPDL